MNRQDVGKSLYLIPIVLICMVGSWWFFVRGGTSRPSPVAVTTETVGTSPVTKTVEAGTWSDWIPIPAGYHDTSTASIPQSEESGMKKEYRAQGGIKQIKYGTYFGEHATEVRYYSKQKTSFTVKFVPN